MRTMRWTDRRRSAPMRVYLWLNTAAIIFLTASFAWWAFAEPPYLSYPQQPFPTVTHVVVAGQGVRFKVYRCSNAAESRSFLVSHRLIGRVTIDLPAAAYTVYPGCGLVPAHPIAIPDDTPPGTYHVEGIAEVPGLIRTAKVAFTTQEFEVTAP